MSTTTRTLAASLGGLAATALLAAQSPAPGHVVGWGWNNTPLTVCSSVYTQDVENNCPKAVIQGSSLCSQKGTGGGGTAYDPRMQAAWVSNGVEIALHDLNTRRMICRFNATVSGNGYVVSGLALSDTRRELFQLEIAPGLLVLSSYDVSNPCKPVHNKNACQVKNTGTSATAMGLAYDEARDLLYYVTSISGFAGWINTVHVVLRGRPCTDLSTFSVNYCAQRPGSPLSGLGYDACSQRLYATDGKGIRVLLLTDPVKGVFKDLTGTNACCQFTGIGVWMGLAVVPNWSRTIVGKSCLDKPCGNCTGMQLGLIGGDASLGNRDFGIRLSGAPTGSRGLFYVALGNCTKGVQFPGLCGPIHTSLTPPWPLLAGSYAAQGSTPCSGQATVVIGVPPDPALCKVTACTQWLVVCPTALNWAGLTNAVQFTIG
ncbi:MAG: hypothetical protein ACYST0_07305, partial [Planctomycetota bacterium]